MKKLHKRLTKDQLDRKVIFSSTLSTDRTERSSDNIHEVKATDEDYKAKIERLLNDKFFNDSPYKYNIIRRWPILGNKTINELYDLKLKLREDII